MSKVYFILISLSILEIRKVKPVSIRNVHVSMHEIIETVGRVGLAPQPTDGLSDDSHTFRKIRFY